MDKNPISLNLKLDQIKTVITYNTIQIFSVILSLVVVFFT